MRRGSGQADDPPATGQQARSATPRLIAWHGDLAAWIDRLGWLRTTSDWLTAVLGPVRERHQDNLVLELLHGGRWIGHPLHPALSDLPVGLWAGVVVLDATDRDPAPRRGLDAAGMLSAAGILAAGATALTGLNDWAVSNDQDRRVGLFHGLLNGAATALQGASLAARLGGHRGSARTLGVASMAVTTAAAFVGGHLVQGRGAMVNRVASHTGPTRWVKTVSLDDLPDHEAKGVDVEGRKVLLYRDDETVYAIDDVCSHAGAVLSRGQVVDCVVTCPLHESQFDVRDGHIVRGPAHHPQPALPSRVRNGWVEVRGSQPGRRRANT